MVSCSAMWPLRALSITTAICYVHCTLFDFRILGVTKRNAQPTISCYDMPIVYDKSKIDNLFDSGWQQQPTTNMLPTPAPLVKTTEKYILKRISRSDKSSYITPDLIKEHAKLVQDINGLRQMVYVAPLEDKEYEDSIFPEIIETSSLPPAKFYAKLTSPTVKPTRTIPVLVFGSTNQHQIVKTSPIKFSENTINLIGTTVTPLEKHPYPFVVQSAMKSMRVCVTARPMQVSTKKPSLWQRLLSIIPR